MKVLSNARPIRLAYLVEDNPEYEFALDAITQASYGAWGGRFHIVVPCANGKIQAEFVPWLEAYDPDIIYSYADLSDDTVADIHERIYPSYFTRHSNRHVEVPSVRSHQPRHEITCLSVETLIPILGQIARNDKRSQAKILETYYGNAANDRFLQINFGQFIGSVGHSLSRPLEEYAALLHVLKPEELQPRAQSGVRDSSTVESRAQLLQQMATNPIVTMASLASFDVPRLHLSYSKWAYSFGIVVGNSFADRVTHWNMRSLYPRWRDSDPVQMWLPETDIEDEELVAGLAKYLRARNYVSRDQNNSQPSITIYSASVSSDRLEKFATKLKTLGPLYRVQVKPLSSIADHVPTLEELDRAYFGASNSFGAYNHRDWQKDEVVNKEINIRAPKPNHIHLLPPSSWSAHSGAWAVDLGIERHNDLSPYENRTQDWVLPRRLRMVSAFKRGYQLAGSKSLALPRTSGNGCLTLFADRATDIDGVRLPSDEDAIRQALIAGRDWWPFVVKRDNMAQLPAQLVVGAERSNNGRYFWGTLSMFGGLDKIRNHLLVQFWQEQFATLGGSYEAGDSARAQLESRLEKVLRGQMADRVKEAIPRIAEIALKEAEKQSTRYALLSWSDLEKSHEQYIEKYWIENPRLTDESEALEQEERVFQRNTLERSLQRLCDMGALHQGHELKCSRCLHRNWISIEDLRRKIACEVCHTEMAAPISESWKFRLNGFLQEALRTHGILPLFWALEKRRSESHHSFYFEGPVKLYYSQQSHDDRRSDGEIDLTLVADGKVEMLEVKASCRQLSKGIGFAEVAKRLRPDFATIAVMEPFNNRISASFEKFSKALLGTGIIPKLMTLEDHDLSEGPHLSETKRHKIF